MTRFNLPRSSDSNVDFEHVATLKELQEMTMSEKTYESPQDQTSCSFPTVPPEPEHLPRPRTSRSTSRASHRSQRSQQSQRQTTEQLAILNDDVSAKEQHVNTEKFAVFKDHSEERPQRPRSSRKNVSPVKPATSGKAIGRSVRAKSDSALASLRGETMELEGYGLQAHIQSRSLGVQSAVKEVLHDIRSQTPSNVPAYDLIDQLHWITKERAQLVKQLQALDQQENDVLAQLARPTSPILTSHVRSLSNVNATMIPQHSTPLPSISDPINDLIQPIDFLHPNPQQPRSFSAPPEPTPLAPRQRDPQRAPLEDKTEESLAGNADSIYVAWSLDDTLTRRTQKDSRIKKKVLSVKPTLMTSGPDQRDSESILAPWSRKGVTGSIYVAQKPYGREKESDIDGEPQLAPVKSIDGASGALKRLPLTDETEVALADSLTDSVHLFQELVAASAPEKHTGNGFKRKSEALRNVGPTPTRRGRSVLVPVNFGQEEEQVPRDALTATPVSLAPGLKKGMKTVSDPVSSIPRFSKDYKVPSTVARKQWAF